MTVHINRGLKHLIFDLESKLLVSPRFWWLYAGCIKAFARNPVRFIRKVRELKAIYRQEERLCQEQQ